jgi:hypothetical protein
MQLPALETVLLETTPALISTKFELPDKIKTELKQLRKSIKKDLKPNKYKQTADTINQDQQSIRKPAEKTSNDLGNSIIPENLQKLIRDLDNARNIKLGNSTNLKVDTNQVTVFFEKKD